MERELDRSNQQGFTLIELLVVLTIIAALAVAVFVALNPLKRIMDSRNSRRITDSETILTAVHEYVIDNKGTIPAGITADGTDYMLGTNATGCAVTQGGCNTTGHAACVNLATLLASYLKSIPIDPLAGTYSAGFTGYAINVNPANQVVIRACGGENNNGISVSR